jgi:hypothetical protein
MSSEAVPSHTGSLRQQGPISKGAIGKFSLPESSMASGYPSRTRNLGKLHQKICTPPLEFGGRRNDNSIEHDGKISVPRVFTVILGSLFILHLQIFLLDCELPYICVPLHEPRGRWTKLKSLSLACRI